MPAMRRFKVIQTREVLVDANTVVEAARIAEAAFVHGQNSNGTVAHGTGPEGVWGNTAGHIREVQLDIKEVRPGER